MNYSKHQITFLWFFIAFMIQSNDIVIVCSFSKSVFMSIQFIIMKSIWSLFNESKSFHLCLYNITKITMQVHKFSLFIVNGTVMIAIEHINLFNSVFKLWFKCRQRGQRPTVYEQRMRTSCNIRTHIART